VRVPDDLDFVHRFVPGSRPLTVLALHGTGGDESSLLPLAAALAPGAAVLSPRGKVLEAGMPRFFRRLREGVFDVEDVRRRAAELAGFASRAAAHYGLDRRRIVALGYSNGANAAVAVLLGHPGTLAGAVLLRPAAPQGEVPRVDLGGVPVWVGAGRADPLVPPAETERLRQVLEASGAQVTVHWAEAGHGLGPGELEEARRWLAARFAG
jgi:predicted esterase